MNFQTLIKSPLFKGLTGEEMERLLAKSNYKVRLYPAGTMIVQSGDGIVSLMIVLSGHVRGEMMDTSGHTIKIEDIYPPQALAAAFMFGSGSSYPVNVYANIDSEILIIDKSDFLTMMHEWKSILVNYLDVVCSRAIFLSERLRFLAFRTIKSKLAHYLLCLPGADRGEVKVDRTQQDLADYFGVARPSLARAMAEMDSDGIISVDRRSIRIRDHRSLVLLTEL